MNKHDLTNFKQWVTTKLWLLRFYESEVITIMIFVIGICIGVYYG